MAGGLTTSVGSVAVKDLVSFDTYGINEADDDSINRECFGFWCHAGARPLSDEDKLSFSGAEGVDSDEGAAGGDKLGAAFFINPVRLDDQQFVAGHRGCLLRSDNRAGY